MKAEGLNNEEIRAMLEKDLDKLKKLSGLESLRSNGIMVSSSTISPAAWVLRALLRGLFCSQAAAVSADQRV